jgi:serine protease Do
VEEGSPADRAGLKPGDVITHYNGEEIDGFERLVEMTRELAPGTKVKLEVVRREQVKSIELELADFE